MKNVVLALVTIITFASCQQQKIGYIDNGKVINEIEEKKDIEAKYKDKNLALKKRIDSIGQALQIEAKQVQQEVKKLSPEQVQAKYDVFGQKQQVLQQQIQFEQQQLQQAFQTEIDSVIVKVKTYVGDYGKKNGYTYILGTSEVSASVMYGTEENDLSKTILEALDAEYKK